MNYARGLQVSVAGTCRVIFDGFFGVNICMRSCKKDVALTLQL